MIDTIKEALVTYLPSIIMVIGLIEYVKNWFVKGDRRQRVYLLMQLFASLLAGLLLVTSAWIGDIGLLLLFSVVYAWGMILSLTTLFYDLIVKKIRDAGGQVKGA